MNLYRPHRWGCCALTAQIVSAHVAGNAVGPAELPVLIGGVCDTLAGLGAPVPTEEIREPEVPVEKSIQRDHLMCLEDGAKLTMLKRYTQSRFGLTQEQCRRRWGLAADYPMVAPGYAERRSALAKQFGLGRRPTTLT